MVLHCYMGMFFDDMRLRFNHPVMRIGWLDRIDVRGEPLSREGKSREKQQCSKQLVHVDSFD